MFRLTTNVARMTTPEAFNRHLVRVTGEAIKAAAMSQRVVAERAGIPLVTLNRRLTGKAALTVPELASIAEVIGARLVDLVSTAEADAVAEISEAQPAA